MKSIPLEYTFCPTELSYFKNLIFLSLFLRLNFVTSSNPYSYLSSEICSTACTGKDLWEVEDTSEFVDAVSYFIISL